MKYILLTLVFCFAASAAFAHPVKMRACVVPHKDHFGTAITKDMLPQGCHFAKGKGR